jgi:hypothetical protein
MKKQKGRMKGAKNLIQTDKKTHTFYCSQIVWQDAKKKHGRKLSSMIEGFLRDC